MKSDDLIKRPSEKFRDIVIGGLSGIPIAGGVISSSVSEAIGKSENARLILYVENINTNVSNLSERLEDDFFGIFEEGCDLAKKAKTKTLINFISEVVKNGITGDRELYLNSKYVLRIIRDMDEIDLGILYEMSSSISDYHSFSDFFIGKIPDGRNNQESVEAVRELRLTRLNNLGLISDEAGYFSITRSGNVVLEMGHPSTN